MLTCRSLRGAILTSGFLLISAWLAEVAARSGLFATVAGGYLAFALLIASAAVLGVTFLLSLLPANAERLASCEH